MSLWLKFTTQGFLNNTASESTAFIRAGKHHLNGQAENGWIKLFFSPLFNGSDSQKIQSRLGEEWNSYVSSVYLTTAFVGVNNYMKITSFPPLFGISVGC